MVSAEFDKKYYIDNSLIYSEILNLINIARKNIPRKAWFVLRNVISLHSLP